MTFVYMFRIQFCIILLWEHKNRNYVCLELVQNYTMMWYTPAACLGLLWITSVGICVCLCYHLFSILCICLLAHTPHTCLIRLPPLSGPLFIQITKRQWFWFVFVLSTLFSCLVDLICVWHLYMLGCQFHPDWRLSYLILFSQIHVMLKSLRFVVFWPICYPCFIVAPEVFDEMWDFFHWTSHCRFSEFCEVLDFCLRSDIFLSFTKEHNIKSPSQ